MKKYLAEFLGTFILVFVACGAAGFSGGIGGYVGILGIAVVFGITYAAVSFIIGHISGAHVNPAVSLAMFVSRKLSAIDFFGYVIAQMLGGIAAAFSLKALTLTFDTEIMDYYATYYGIKFSNIGTNGYGEASTVGINMWGALAVEAILTCIFVLVFLAVSMEKEFRKNAGIMAGLALAAVHIIGVPLTGASLNPARSFGPAFVTYIFGDAASLAQEWVFVVGPVIGALIAVAVWALLNLQKREKIQPAVITEENTVEEEKNLVTVNGITEPQEWEA